MIVFALLLASKLVFMNYLLTFLLFIWAALLTNPAPPVLFMPPTTSWELFKSIEEFTVCCRGRFKLWLSAPEAYWIPPTGPAITPMLLLKAYWLMRIAA